MRPPRRFTLSIGTNALRWLLALFMAMCVATGSRIALAANDATRPNIVLILADDLGWTDLGCFGSGYYATPHIDRLAEQGMRWTSAYTNGPNCAPTRACLMTGRYSPRHGIYTVGSGARGHAKFRKLTPVQNSTELPLGERTLADTLRSAGYRTGMFGKWHLGNGPQHHPSQRGFDTALVTQGGHFAPRFRTDPATPVKPGTYLADFLTDQALKFLDEAKDRPFFLYLPHFSVHTPIQARESLIAKYRDKPPDGRHRDPVYAAMIDSLDQSVGRIMARLDALDLTDNTLVIFTSDNGGHGGYEGIGGSTGRNITGNRPLRGGKGMLYEGGVRVPLVVRWPGVVTPGSVCDQPVISIDWHPTLAEIAGGDRQTDPPLDGTSLVPLLRSAGLNPLDRDAIYWHFPGYLQADEKQGTWRTTPAGSIRSGGYKLIEYFEDGRLELYNLRLDIGEKENLVQAMPDRAAELHKKLIAWRKAVDAPMPRPKGARSRESRVESREQSAVRRKMN